MEGIQGGPRRGSPLRAGVALLLCLCGVLPGQQPGAAEQAERLLHQAVLEGRADSLILEQARALEARFPDRPYPRAILGDTLFRMRRLRAAAETYREALERMSETERRSALGQAVEENLGRVRAELEAFERGLEQEGRARVLGWSALLLLAGLFAGAAWLIRRTGSIARDPERAVP